MSKRAVILAGGKGTRLKPYTDTVPKPLVPLGEFSMLEIILHQLAFYGFEHVTLALNHEAEAIQARIGRGEAFGLLVDYSLEDIPLGTMGPLSLIRDLPRDFLVMNSDILTDLDFDAFWQAHCRERSLFSIAAYQYQAEQAFGILDMDEEGRLREFREKPLLRVNVSMGIYMARRDVLAYIPRGIPFGFDQLVHRLISEQLPPRVHIHQGQWQDIGCPEDYEKAVGHFQACPEQFLPRLTFSG